MTCVPYLPYDAQNDPDKLRKYKYLQYCLWFSVYQSFQIEFYQNANIQIWDYVDSCSARLHLCASSKIVLVTEISKCFRLRLGHKKMFSYFSKLISKIKTLTRYMYKRSALLLKQLQSWNLYFCRESTTLILQAEHL